MAAGNLPMAVFEPQPVFGYLTSSALPDDAMLLWPHDGQVIAPPMFSAEDTEDSEDTEDEVGTSKKK